MRSWPVALLFLCLVASAAPDAHAQSSDDNAALAQQLYRQGLERYDAHDYVGALREFRAAHTVYASPNSRLMIARALRGMSHFDEAVAEYELTLHEAADRAQTDVRYAATRDAAESEMRALESRIARLQVTATDVPSWARVRINGRDVPVAALGVPIPVMPGNAEIRIEAYGYQPLSQTATTTAGQTQQLAVTLQRDPSWNGSPPSAAALADWRRSNGAPAPTGTETAGGGAARTSGTTTAEGATTSSASPAPSQPSAFVTPSAVTIGALGLGVVGFIVGGIFGGLAMSQYDSLSQQCNNMHCPSTLQGAVDTGRTYQIIADTGFVVGGIGVIAGAVLYFVRDRAHAHEQVRVGFQPNGVTLSGSF